MRLCRLRGKQCKLLKLFNLKMRNCYSNVFTESLSQNGDYGDYNCIPIIIY